MRIVLINPNSTEAMTEAIAAVARRTLPAKAELLALTNHGAPPAIQGAEDGDRAVPGVLELIGAHAGADGYIIACFDDTGLAEARALTAAPVLGVGQSAFHLAALWGGPFGVVTTLPVSAPVIADNIAASGLGALCTEVCASGVPVLDLEADPDGSAEKVSAQIARMEEIGASRTIILGCACMSAILPALSRRHSVPLLDPVACAATLLAAICGLRAGQPAR